MDQLKKMSKRGYSQGITYLWLSEEICIPEQVIVDQDQESSLQRSGLRHSAVQSRIVDNQTIYTTEAGVATQSLSEGDLQHHPSPATCRTHNVITDTRELRNEKSS